ncbi:hypothetical protein ACWGI8_18965 [Streptomyces sp. NPDC054841]
MIRARPRGAVDGLFKISGPTNGARPAELTVVVQSKVRPLSYH